MKFVDANVFLYAIIGSPKNDCEIAKNILQRIEKGEETAVILPVIQEVVDWLEYNRRKNEVHGVLTAINSYLSMRKLSATWEDFLPAMEDVRKHGIDFIDSVTLQVMKRYNVDQIYSADKDFDRIQWVKRIWQ
jgi:predicted nucleic acid-binding protein